MSEWRSRSVVIVRDSWNDRMQAHPRTINIS